MVLEKITSDKQHQKYLDRMKDIFDAKLGTPECKELNLLVDVIEAWEDKYYSIS